MTPARRKRIIRDTLLFFVLIAESDRDPGLLLLSAAYNILLSFMDWDLVAPYPEWVALENYVGLFTDIEFWQIMMNTLIFTGVTVVGSLVGGITLGTLLASRVPLTGLVRTFSFTPHMIPGAAVGMLWLFMFDPNFGLSRWLFNLVGMDSLTGRRPRTGRSHHHDHYLWQWLGFVTVIYCNRDPHLSAVHEAASLDGANSFQRLGTPCQGARSRSSWRSLGCSAAQAST